MTLSTLYTCVQDVAVGCMTPSSSLPNAKSLDTDGERSKPNKVSGLSCRCIFPMVLESGYTVLGACRGLDCQMATVGSVKTKGCAWQVSGRIWVCRAAAVPATAVASAACGLAESGAAICDVATWIREVACDERWSTEEQSPLWLFAISCCTTSGEGRCADFRIPG